MALIKTNARSATALDATILSGNLPALNASALTTINASNISSGTLSTSRYVAGEGIVRQVLVKALASNFSMNSGTTADVTNFSQAITMADTNNKLLVMYNLNIRMQGAGASSSPSSNFYITNAGNTVLANTYIHQAGLAANNKERTENSSGAILITPATTDAYTIKARVNNASEGGTVQIFGGSYTSSITLMEIVV